MQKVLRVIQALGLVICLSTTSHAQHLYWTGPGGISRAAPDGAQPETFLPARYHPSAGVVAVDSTRGKMYWTVYGGIERSNLDGSNVERFFDTPEKEPQGLAIGVIQGFMYWSDWSGETSTIKRIGLDGQFPVDLIPGLGAPRGIAVDEIGGKIYWAETGVTVSDIDKIRRANLDGTQVEDIVATGLQFPLDVDLDVAAGTIYWIDSGGPNSPNIAVSNLDGSNRQVLVNRLTVPTLYYPEAIVVEPGKRIFFTNRGLGLGVWTANLDGGNAHVVVSRYATSLPGLDVDNSGLLYWSDKYDKQTLFRANTNGSNVTDLFPTQLESALALTIHRGAGEVFWSQQRVEYRSDPLVQRAMLTGEDIRPVMESPEGIGRALALDSSTNTLYWSSSDRGRSIGQSGLDGQDPRVLVILGGHNMIEDTTAAAIDVTGRHLYVIGTAYPGTTKIVRIHLDTAEMVTLYSLERTSYHLGRGFALDLPRSQMFWPDSLYNPLDGGTITSIYRADLDGENITPIFTADDTYLHPEHIIGLAVDPIGQRLYASGLNGRVLFHTNFNGADLQTIDGPSALHLFFDPCGRQSAVSAADIASFDSCMTGPVNFLSNGCSCADLTADSRVDLRDVSALQLSFTTP